MQANHSPCRSRSRICRATLKTRATRSWVRAQRPGPRARCTSLGRDPKSLYFAKSTNGGVSFGKSAAIIDCAGWDFAIKGLGRASSLPSVGVDITSGPSSGTIYVNWGDTRNGDPDVFLVSSGDGGATWSQPLRVNNDERGNGKEQWFPSMLVDPIDGSINIAYYDRGSQTDTNTDVTLARSVDGGKTFVYTKLNDVAYDLNRLGFFGDYLGIDAYGGRVAVLWMHPLDKTKKLGISSAVLDFEPGDQEQRNSRLDYFSAGERCRDLYRSFAAWWL